MRILLFCFLFTLHAWSNEQAKSKAQEKAQKWLKLVDEKQYSASHAEASTLFKQQVTLEQWKTSIAGARDPLGKVISRTFEKASFHTSLPGAPDGKYVVIIYKTSFANKKEAIETITPMEDAGSWKVSGYFIR